ncbi:tetratricopeptide repeat protein [Corynebacterium variabile]|uniref:Thioredoxin domain-containing protein n=1 Tax=Corynebacterium variabile TaxID=1727 RepID=A0A0X2NKQ1_9CORY|nr:tetratricopeptide repeat protein [Corynebacterium variabile]CUU66066.1 Thioredoxin domain-containing protein [Corynebacterium variabile]
MTSPRPAGPADSSPNRFAARAVDLGAVKEAADARDRAKEEAVSGAPVALAAPVTAESFEQDLVVRSTQVPVIVQLGSSRAPGSDEMSHAFASSALGQTEPASWVFRYVDVDTVPEIAQAFGVQSVPTVLALAAGRPLTSFEGVQPPEQTDRFISAVLQATAGKLPGLPSTGEPAGEEQSPADPRFTKAAEALDREDYVGAVALYDAVIDDVGAPAEAVSEAKAARATAVLLGRSADGSADDIDRMLLEGRRREAFDVLIDRMRTSAGDEKDAARTRLLGLFSLYDPADPEVIDARTRMASALF